MTEPWQRIKDFSEREIIDSEVIEHIATYIGCKSDELEFIHDEEGSYVFPELARREVDLPIFWSRIGNYPSASIYLSAFSLKDGGLHVIEHIRDSGGSISNYWRKAHEREE